jgi:hypothetical protein
MLRENNYVVSTMGRLHPVDDFAVATVVQSKILLRNLPPLSRHLTYKASGKTETTWDEGA